MPHAMHKARRILTSDVPHAPVKRRRSRFEQQVLLTLSVGFTMLIIVSLYVASFRTRNEMLHEGVEHPRWSLLDEDLLRRAAPVKEELMHVKQTLLRLASAGTTQAQAAAILKAKVQARAAGSASATPATPEPPETPADAEALADKP